MEYGGTSTVKIKQRESEECKKWVHRSIERNVRRDILERGSTDGSVIKGNGPHFVGHKKEYRNRLCDCGILMG